MAGDFERPAPAIGDPNDKTAAASTGSRRGPTGLPHVDDAISWARKYQGSGMRPLEVCALVDEIEQLRTTLGALATTADERRVLDALADAWNAFTFLDGRHPDDRDDFRRAIHAAQALIACRIAQRADPETWPTHR
jgi:hypothetical protein